MNETITILVILFLFLIYLIFRLGLTAKRNEIPGKQLFYVLSSMAVAITAVILTSIAQESNLDAAVLVSPIILALALVSLQDFFNYKTSKQIEKIHTALKPKESDIYKAITSQNESLLAEIKSLKKDISKLNLIITHNEIPKTIIIENRSSLISLSPRFSKKERKGVKNGKTI